MSLLNLCPLKCEIYESITNKTAIGTYTIELSPKWINIPTRITQLDSKENITDGQEKENPNIYRFYFTSLTYQNVLTTDYILCNGILYDILFVDKCYKRHLQVDVKRNTNQNIEINNYLLLSQNSQSNGFITYEDDGLIEIGVES